MCIRTIVALVGITILSGSCTKEPGEGGKAEIRGSVYTVEYNSNSGQPTGVEYFTPEARVYITYGDHDFYDDDLRTGPDGLFVFSWLRKGKYTVFTYSECPTCPSGQEVVSATVDISDRKGVIELPPFTVANY